MKAVLTGLKRVCTMVAMSALRMVETLVGLKAWKMVVM